MKKLIKKSVLFLGTVCLCFLGLLNLQPALGAQAVSVSSAESLIDYCSRGTPYTITLANDITLNEGQTVYVAKNCNITINGNGKKIIQNYAGSTFEIQYGGRLTVSNLTVNRSDKYPGGNIFYVEAGGSLVVESGNYRTGDGTAGQGASVINAAGMVTINGGTFAGAKAEFYAVCLWGANNYVISGGTFADSTSGVGLLGRDGTVNTLTVTGGSFIGNVNNGMTIGDPYNPQTGTSTATINGGSFYDNGLNGISVAYANQTCNIKRANVYGNETGLLAAGGRIVFVSTSVERCTIFGGSFNQSVARKIAYPLEYKIGNKDMGGKHNLGMSALKNLPLQLCEPIAITKNTAKHSEDNSVVIWTNWIDRNNEGIMVAIRINKEGKIEISNTIATVFQAGEKYVNQFFENKDNILYTKNNEDIQKLLPFRRYVPEAKSDDVFIYRLLQENENVNSESEEYFSQEINSLSPRFILASTLMNATTNVEEQEHLKKYKEAITSIEDKEDRLKITRNAIRNAIFEREAGLVVSMESINKMKQAAKKLERSIDYWDKKLLELEATTPLKNLMERQRKTLSEKYMKEARTRLDESRARFYASNRREQIKKNANSLISWLTRPDNTHYIPDVMKQPVVEFLSSIDFVSSKASPDSNTTKEWVSKMDKLREMLIDIEADTSDYKAQQFMDDVDPELRDNIRTFLARNQNNAKLC